METHGGVRSADLPVVSALGGEELAVWCGLLCCVGAAHAPDCLRWGGSEASTRNTVSTNLDGGITGFEMDIASQQAQLPGRINLTFSDRPCASRAFVLSPGFRCVQASRHSACQAVD